MKGKEALASAQRREREALEGQANLKTALAQCQKQLVDTQRQVTDIGVAIDEAARLRLQLKGKTSDEVEALKARNEELVLELLKIQEHVAGIQKHWDKLMSRLGTGNIEGAEEMLTFLHDWDQRPVIALSPSEQKFARKYGTESLRKLQKAKGDRLR